MNALIHIVTVLFVTLIAALVQAAPRSASSADELTDIAAIFHLDQAQYLPWSTRELLSNRRRAKRPPPPKRKRPPPPKRKRPPPPKRKRPPPPKRKPPPPLKRNPPPRIIATLSPSPPPKRASTASPVSAECNEAIASVSWIRTVPVGSSAELQAALNAAMPGDVIELEPGTYSASLEDGTRLLMQDKAGTTTYPIVICGPQTAVLDGNSAASTNVNRKLRDALIDKSFAEPGALVLRRVSHVHIRGLTFANGRMGLMLLEASNCKVSKTIVRRIDITGISGHSLTSCTISDSEIFEVHRGVILNYSMGCTLSNLRVYNTGNVGIKLQRNSTYNTITKCYITDTGKRNLGFGEGIYIGSAPSNSLYVVDGRQVFLPDFSDFNTITENIIGPGVTADMIDIKPLTKGGTVTYNVFDGTDISGQTGADSWVASNGSNYTFRGNIGRNLPSFGEGFPTRVVASNPNMPSIATGFHNVYDANDCDMQGADSSVLKYCIRIINANTRGQGNIVKCNNVVNAPYNLTNVMCGDEPSVSVRSIVPLSVSLAQAAADEEDYQAENAAEAQRDDPPPPGWLDEVFPLG